MQETYLGIDIGASKTLIVLLSQDKVEQQIKIETPQKKKELIKALKKNISEMIRSNTQSIGIGMAAILDKDRKKVLKSPNLSYLNDSSFQNIIKKETGINSFLENDAACFTWAEFELGAGKNKSTVVGITLGSGLGGGIVHNGNLYLGSWGGGSEIGHMVINFEGPQCSCGNKGCFEQYGSERFFKKKGVFPKELCTRATEGDKEAEKVFKEYGKKLGIGLSNIVNILDPDTIVLGGGITNASSLFLQTTQKETKKRIISPQARDNLNIKIANLGETSPAIGAALLAKERLKQKIY